MKENTDRLNDKRMEYYNFLYKKSKKWDGKQDLSNKKIIIYCEQGYGDIVQMFRYVDYLKNNYENAFIILHCPKELGILFAKIKNPVDKIIHKNEEKLPAHDYHVLSFSLPFLLKDFKDKYPYIKFDEKNKDVVNFSKNKKIGIAWEGNKVEGIPLKYFKSLEKIGDLFVLQKSINDKNLLQGADNINLQGVQINDFIDTARLINSMDIVVSVDTCILHLAGALNKKTYGLLNKEYDERWNVKKWYDSVTLLRVDNDWQKVFKEIEIKLN